MKVVLANIFCHFDVESLDQLEDLKPILSITMKTRVPVRVRLRRGVTMWHHRHHHKCCSSIVIFMYSCNHYGYIGHSHRNEILLSMSAIWSKYLSRTLVESPHVFSNRLSSSMPSGMREAIFPLFHYPFPWKEAGQGCPPLFQSACVLRFHVVQIFSFPMDRFCLSLWSRKRKEQCLMTVGCRWARQDCQRCQVYKQMI